MESEELILNSEIESDYFTDPVPYEEEFTEHRRSTLLPIESQAPEIKTDKGEPGIFYVILKGMPFSTIDDDIIEFLAPEVKLERKSQIKTIKRQRGFFNGDRIVELYNSKDVDNTLAKNGKYIGKRWVEVLKCTAMERERLLKREDTVHRQSSSRFSLDAAPITAPQASSKSTNNFIRLSGLPFIISEAEIISFLSGCSVLQDGLLFGPPDLTRNRENTCNGDVFVELATENDVARALSKHNQTLRSRYVQVSKITFEEVEAYMRRLLKLRNSASTAPDQVMTRRAHSPLSERVTPKIERREARSREPVKRVALTKSEEYFADNNLGDPREMPRSDFGRANDPRELPRSEFGRASDARELPRSDFGRPSDAREMPRSDFGRASDPREIPRSDFGRASDPREVPRSDFGHASDPREMPRSDFGRAIDPREMPRSDFGLESGSRHMPQSVFIRERDPMEMRDSRFDCEFDPRNSTRLAADLERDPRTSARTGFEQERDPRVSTFDRNQDTRTTTLPDHDRERSLRAMSMKSHERDQDPRSSLAVFNDRQRDPRPLEVTDFARLEHDDRVMTVRGYEREPTASRPALVDRDRDPRHMPHRADYERQHYDREVGIEGFDRERVPRAPVVPGYEPERSYREAPPVVAKEFDRMPREVMPKEYGLGYDRRPMVSEMNVRDRDPRLMTSSEYHMEREPISLAPGQSDRDPRAMSLIQYERDQERRLLPTAINDIGRDQREMQFTGYDREPRLSSFDRDPRSLVSNSGRVSSVERGLRPTSAVDRDFIHREEAMIEARAREERLARLEGLRRANEVRDIELQLNMKKLEAAQMRQPPQLTIPPPVITRPTMQLPPKKLAVHLEGFPRDCSKEEIKEFLYPSQPTYIELTKGADGRLIEASAEFAHIEDFNIALSKHRKYIGSRWISVKELKPQRPDRQPDRKRQQRSKSKSPVRKKAPTLPPQRDTLTKKDEHSLKVMGIPWESTELDIEDFFAKVSKPVSIKIIKDGDGRGESAIVGFSSHETMLEAEKLDRKYIKNRYVIIKRC